jgi:anti-sigma regulatory factor (Ser/Thr protein kinase)
MSARSGGYIHDALFYGSDSDLIETSVKFFREGAKANENLVLGCTPEQNAAIIEAYGGEFRGRVLEAGESYRRAAETIVTYQRLIDGDVQLGARGVRVVADVGIDRNPDEWLRYEAIVNRALGPYPIWGVCVYDKRRVRREVLEAVRDAHPFVVEDGVREPNGGYLEPDVFLLKHAKTSRLPLEDETPDVEIAEVRSLSALREAVAPVSTLSGLPERDVTDFLYALNELATNALIHGGRPVRARVWVRPATLLATVLDAGEGFTSSLAAYPDTAGEPLRPGSGLQVVRRLCDQFDTYVTDEGFTARIRTGGGA